MCILTLYSLGKNQRANDLDEQAKRGDFCSRKEPLLEGFSNTLAARAFKEKISIPYGEDRNLRLSLAFKK